MMRRSRFGAKWARPFMPGRINVTPEAERQLNEIDAIDALLVFPLAGRARDDVRPGMRTTAFDPWSSLR